MKTFSIYQLELPKYKRVFDGINKNQSNKEITKEKTINSGKIITFLGRSGEEFLKNK
jgi:hypothetical protein